MIPDFLISCHCERTRESISWGLPRRRTPRNDDNFTNPQHGFSMAEIILVIGILGFVAALTGIMNIDAYRGYVFRDDRALAVAALQRARSQAISNVCLGDACTDGQPHGVHFETGQIVIFQGSVYDPVDPLNEFIAMNGPTMVAVPTNIIFAQLSGNATFYPSPSVTLHDPPVLHTSSITINSEGRISWTN